MKLLMLPDKFCGKNGSKKKKKKAQSTIRSFSEKKQIEISIK